MSLQATHYTQRHLHLHVSSRGPHSVSQKGLQRRPRRPRAPKLTSEKTKLVEFHFGSDGAGGKSKNLASINSQLAGSINTVVIRSKPEPRGPTARIRCEKCCQISTLVRCVLANSGETF